MNLEKKPRRGGARPGAGRKPKSGTVQWKVRTTVEVQAELRKRASTMKVTPGDVINELVDGLSDNEKTMINGLFMEERRRLENLVYTPPSYEPCRDSLPSFDRRNPNARSRVRYL